MAAEQLFLLKEIREEAKGIFRMTLSGAHRFQRPGQFAQLTVPGFYLRRPISVCSYDQTGFTMLFRVVGEGTEALSKCHAGDKIDCLTGLGNGFTAEGTQPLLIGGGIGCPPMYGLAEAFVKQGVQPTVLLGFRSAAECILKDDFAALGAKVLITTEDGSLGQKGFVTARMPELTYDRVYACGPVPMLKAVRKAAKTPGSYSLEERMGCGFGVCVGCTIHVKSGAARVCKDGPVFPDDELLWD